MLNPLSFLRRKSPMTDDLVLPNNAEGLPQIAITDELLAAVRAVNGARDVFDRATIQHAETLGRMQARAPALRNRAMNAELAEEIRNYRSELLEEATANLDAAKNALADMVIAAVAEAGRRAEHDIEFQRQREHAEAQERRRQREAERQHAEERRGHVIYTNRDGARIKSATGAELWVRHAELATAGWPLEVNDHVRFEIDHRGGRKFAVQLRRLMPNSTDEWRDD